MTNMELSEETDFSRVLELEEEAIKAMCDEIIKLKPDIVVTEKGISDLAQHYLVKAGITALRRAKKTDNNRIDMHQYGIWEPFAVKAQVLKTAIETAILLL